MKLRLIGTVAVVTLFSIAAQATDHPMPIKVNYTSPGGVNYSDFDPANLTNACAKAAYEKLSKIAAQLKLTSHDSDKFHGKGYLRLNITQPTSDSVGEISVFVSESDTASSWKKIFDFMDNPDSSSHDGVPCNIKRDSCFQTVGSALLPQPNEKTTAANCSKIASGINADTIHNLLKSYHGRGGQVSQPIEADQNLSGPTQTTGGQGPSNNGSAANPNQ